jgi:hypothetical protein
MFPTILSMPYCVHGNICLSLVEQHRLRSGSSSILYKKNHIESTVQTSSVGGQDKHQQAELNCPGISMQEQGSTTNQKPAQLDL